MSFDPNDPNWRAISGPPPHAGHGQGGYPQPGYPQPGYPQPGLSQYGFPQKPQQPKKSSTLLYVLAGISGACLLLCLGCGVYGFLLVSNGMQQASKELIVQVQPHPLIQEHIGKVQSLSMNFGESVSINEGKVGKKTAVFDIVGDKGSALLFGEVDDGHDRPARFGQATLLLPNGETHLLSF